MPTMKSHPDSSFLRVLGRKEVLALAFGAMIGWSWVVLTSTWISSAGVVGAILAFLFGGFAILLIGLTYAELAAALPFAGGEHVYSDRALGPGISFICTWAIILGYVSVVAFEAVALPTVLSSLMPGLDRGYLWQIAGWDVYFTWVLTGVLGAMLMTVLNILGVKMVAFVQYLVVLLILLVGTLFVTGSLVSGDSANLQPYFSDGLAGISIVVVMVPFMFVGFDIIPQAAEEIDLPFSDIGTVLVTSVLMAVAWYSLIILAVGLTLPSGELASSEVPTASAATALFGKSAGTLMLLTGLAGILTSWNALIVGGSRAIYALARAGLLPRFLATIHPKYRTPTNAILLIGALSMIAPFFGRPALVWLVNAGGLGIVVAYAFVALSFILLRRNEPELERPFKLPFGLPIGITALLLSLFLAYLYLPGSPSALVWPQEWLIILFWTGLGAALYSRAKRQ